jgi:histidinol-phosphatase
VGAVVENGSEGWLKLLSQIADRADQLALRYFNGGRLEVYEKADNSPVTEADRAIEHYAREVIRVKRPGVGVFGEEFGGGDPVDPRLIIDPIDGTRNFIRGIPIFATLLAIEASGEIVAAIVSAPALRCRWHATVGGGSFLNGRQVRVSSVQELSRVQLFHGDTSGLSEPRPPDGLFSLMEKVRRNRGFGDFYQHMLVAQGSGEISIDTDVEPWDIAPLVLIVEEAGGRATALNGQRSIYSRSIVCTNGLLHDDVINALSR